MLRAGPTDDWTSADWEAHRAHAAAHLAAVGADAWKVGADVVAMYEAGRDRAREREAEV